MLTKFIHDNPNWREILSKPPYNIGIKDKDNFTLLKYIQHCDSTDWYNGIVNECRGIIINECGDVVCHGFDRFYNYGEPYAADIDWTTATAAEKIDGSLIKLWVYDGRLRISTNGSIDAYDVEIRTVDNIKGVTTFGDKVYSVLIDRLERAGKTMRWFVSQFAEVQTMMFELVGKDNRVVINYGDDDLYYLGSRYKDDVIRQQAEIAKFFHTPPAYDINGMTIEEVKQMIGGFVNKEGIVVTDAAGNRVKMKNADYLLRHRMSTHISDEELMQIILDGEVTEWCATVPTIAARLTNLHNRYLELETTIKAIHMEYKELGDKEFAEKVKGLHYSPLVFNYKHYGNLGNAKLVLKYI